MKTIQDIVSKFIGKNLEVEIFDEVDNLLIIDWDKIEKDHSKTISKTKGMNNEELSDFFSYNETDLMQISEYFLDEELEEKIENKEYIPFGLLGLCYYPDSFAEDSNHGILLFDLTKGDKNNPPIVLFKEDEYQDVANSFSELKITEAEED